MKNNISKTRKLLGNKLFSIAVITDTHLNQGEEECSSPYAVNRLANGRMRHVIHDLNSRQVACIIHLGDLIHPVPAIPQLYKKAVQCFQEQIAQSQHPIYFVPGNHDIGDKPNDWAPTGVVCEAFVSLWRQYFGEQYFSFEQQGCYFIGIDAQIINSGLACETEQKNWLERFLKNHKNERIFLNIHYPPYLTSPEEIEHYDNLAEPGRSWLLGLLEAYQIEALFAGHVHNFWYYRHGKTDCYLLPSTAFVRQDYSEMYRIPPQANQEAGRNDLAKLGYFLLHVHENGHLVEIIRTYGMLAPPQSPIVKASSKITPLHPQENFHASLGFDMRQNWTERVEIPPNGGLDEFDRKEVRNDYPLMALWEMGVRKLRIPLQDLLNPLTRERLGVLLDQGHEFTLFSYGIPPEKVRRLVAENQNLISTWEIGYNPLHLEALAIELKQIKKTIAVPIYLSQLHSIEKPQGAGEKYYHVINHGFLPEDQELLAVLLSQHGLEETVAGFVFRVTNTMSPWETLLAIAEITRPLETSASLHIRMKGANPAESFKQDLWAANRIAEALAASLTQRHFSVFIDTFADNDRGYFVSHGVVDRLYNPRLGFHVVRNLYGAFQQAHNPLKASPLLSIATGKIAMLHSEKSDYFLLLPDHPIERVSISSKELPNKRNNIWHAFNMKNGQISTETLHFSKNAWHFEPAHWIQNPMLLQLQ